MEPILAAYKELQEHDKKFQPNMPYEHYRAHNEERRRLQDKFVDTVMASEHGDMFSEYAHCTEKPSW